MKADCPHHALRLLVRQTGQDPLLPDHLHPQGGVVHRVPVEKSAIAAVLLEPPHVVEQADRLGRGHPVCGHLLCHGQQPDVLPYLRGMQLF